MPPPKEYDIDASYHEASLALANSTKGTPSKSEQRMNSIGNSIVNVKDHVDDTYAQATSKAFSILKDCVSEFASHSDVLMSALDQVGVIFPFIGVAIIPFKTAISLEMKRRDNDDKVRSLHVTMSDVMETLLLLKHLASPHVLGSDGRSIQTRLEKRLIDISTSIISASKLCDTYVKRRVWSKVLSSTKWQGEFESAIEDFVNHQRSLHAALQMHASLGISSANDSLISLEMKVDKLVEMVFILMRSAEEREISEFIESKGGREAVLKSDFLLRELLSKQKSPKDASTSKGSQVPSTAKDVLTSKGSQILSTVEDVRAEVEMEVDQIVTDNKWFEQKFEEQRRQLEEVKTLVVRESDRVIQAARSGPHDRIVNQDVYDIWKEMNWKSSVKAKHLVMALNDHFADQTRPGRGNGIMSPRSSINNPLEGTSGSIASVASPNTTNNDAWALRFITVQRVQPLIEAIDDDVSSFVTVSEINAFTSAAPQGWSLPRWIAYWTYGFEFTCQWYFRRIRKLLHEIEHASRLAHPSNRRMINNFSISYEVRFVEKILAGLSNVSLYDNIDWDSDVMFLRFKDYVAEEEKELENRMRRVTYYIEDTVTLELISGGARPEKYLLPLLYLLLKRSLWILTRQAVTQVLHSRELEVVEYSILTISGAIRERVQILQDVWRLQNLNGKEQIRKFFYGLYTYVIEDPRTSDYWDRSLEGDMHSVPELLMPSTDNEPALWYPIQQKQLKAFEVFSSLGGDYMSDPQHIMVGRWGGQYMVGRSTQVVYMNVTSVGENGQLSGNGADIDGRFKITGKICGDQVSFVKEYLQPWEGEITKWACKATLNGDMDRMTGVWKALKDFDQLTPTASSDNLTQNEPADKIASGVSNNCTARPVTNGSPATTSTNPELGNTGHKTGDSLDASMDGPIISLVAAETGQDIVNASSGTGSDTSNEIDIESVTGTASIAAGGFEVLRRPVEWFLCRPPAEEFERNRVASLWKFAMNAVRRQVRSRSPRWVYAQRKALKKFEDRLDVVLGYECDGCHKSPGSSRVFCVTCWDQATTMERSVDLCFDCCRDQKEFNSTDNHLHTSDHLMIQLRRQLIRGYFFSRLAFARAISFWAAQQLPSSIPVTLDVDDDTNDTTMGPRCIINGCQTNTIASGPCWGCMDCKLPCFICVRCNTEVERERPWVFERRPNKDFENNHTWAHTLVYIPGPRTTAGHISLSIEERLGRLEGRLEEALKTREEPNTTEPGLHALETRMTERLLRLETMVERLLIASGSVG